MRRRQFLICFAVFLLSLFTAYRLPADEKKHPIDAWLVRQIERDSTEAGMRRATAQARAKWDAEMDETYKALMSRLDAKQKAALVRSQRAWLAFRDAEFKTIGEIVDRKSGTMWHTVATGDRMEIVKTRALMLEGYREDMKE